jgi:hypothetical protein
MREQNVFSFVINSDFDLILQLHDDGVASAKHEHQEHDEVELPVRQLVLVGHLDMINNIIKEQVNTA